MRFYLGTHQVDWLWKTDVPLFISYHRIKKRKSSVKNTLCRWALDSGGFTELNKNGRWTISKEEYAEKALKLKEESNSMDFAAVQDWMCEPVVRRKTGLSVEEHQRLTCESYLDLYGLAPSVKWAPVIQGWEFQDYVSHVSMWRDFGVDLSQLDVVGLGSVCRRQDTWMAEDLVRELSGFRIKLHLFGFKQGGLLRCHEHAASSDSMAWSFSARKRNIRMEGCTHKTCANCLKWALKWREELMASIKKKEESGFQLMMRWQG